MAERVPFPWALALGSPARLFKEKPPDIDGASAPVERKAESVAPLASAAPKRAERAPRVEAVAWSAAWAKATGPPKRLPLGAHALSRAPPFVDGNVDNEALQPRQTGPPVVWALSCQCLQFARPPPVRETRERRAKKKSRAPPSGVAGISPGTRK